MVSRFISMIGGTYRQLSSDVRQCFEGTFIDNQVYGNDWGNLLTLISSSIAMIGELTNDDLQVYKHLEDDDEAVQHDKSDDDVLHFVRLQKLSQLLSPSTITLITRKDPQLVNRPWLTSL